MQAVFLLPLFGGFRQTVEEFPPSFSHLSVQSLIPAVHKKNEQQQRRNDRDF